MFRGINAVNLDTKGRMAIPARYREELHTIADAQLVVTIDTEDHCLLLYPLPHWEVIEAKLQQLASFNPQSRRVQRLLIGHATELELDSHGRILLPAILRDYALIDKKAVLIGQGNKFEIWSEPHWQQQRDQWLQTDLINPEDLPDELKNLAL